MSSDLRELRLEDLLIEWEVLRQAGTPASAVEICKKHGCPELETELQARIAEQLCADQLLDEDATWRSPTTAYGIVGTDGTVLESVATSTRYRILRRQGEGGMGEVLLAEDESLGRNVALKLVHADCANRKDVIERFEREAQVTSRLDHPGIVPVHTVGRAADGRPCYTMRFIEGKTLHEAIQEFHNADQAPRRDPVERSLAFRKLLGHFVDICNTIAYAHAKGVIHRDLKPRNVMLGEFGETWVLDWGLARNVVGKPIKPTAVGETKVPSGPAETQTEYTLGVGTPGYVSPEQIIGPAESIGIASDTYSLGAILYEILTGKPPTRRHRDWQAAVVRGEFARPRLLKPNAPAALEAVSLRAMALDPAARHANAKELAREVENWLADEKVASYREPWRLQLWRLARKHRSLVTSTAAALLVATVSSLAALAVVSGLNQRLDASNRELEASVASEKAAKARADKTLEFFVAGLRRPDPALDGKQLTVYAMLREMVKELEADVDFDPYGRWAILNAIGLTYHGLGEYADAIRLLERAKRLAEERLGEHHPDTWIARGGLGMVYAEVGNLEEAIPLLEETLRAQLATFGAGNPNSLVFRNNLAAAYQADGRYDLATQHYERAAVDAAAAFGQRHAKTLAINANLASTYELAGRLQDAIALYERTVATQVEVLGTRHLDVINSRTRLGRAYHVAGKNEQAVELLQENLEVAQASLGTAHPGTLACRNCLATALSEMGEHDRAIGLCRQNLEAVENGSGDNHPNAPTIRAALGRAYHLSGMHELAIPQLEHAVVLTKRSVGADNPEAFRIQIALGSAYLACHRHDLAVPVLEDALRGFEKVLDDCHPDTLTARNNLASAYRASGRLDLAIPLLEKTLRALEDKLGDDHPNVSGMRGNLAKAYLQARRTGEALPLYERFVANQRQRLVSHPQGLARLVGQVAQDLLLAKQFAPAETYFRESLALREKHEPNVWTTFHVRVLLGEALFGQGKYAEAEPHLLAGYEGLKRNEANIPEESKVVIGESAGLLVRLYEAWGKPDEAARWRAGHGISAIPGPE